MLADLPADPQFGKNARVKGSPAVGVPGVPSGKIVGRKVGEVLQLERSVLPERDHHFGCHALDLAQPLAHPQGINL